MPAGAVAAQFAHVVDGDTIDGLIGGQTERLCYIGRELDGERRLVLDERRQELASERDQVVESLVDVERQLGLG